MKCDWKLYLCDDQGQRIFGLGPLTLLGMVQKYGSLNKAAESMGLSYHKALNMVRNAERGFGVALLEKKAGGTGGGGSALTPQALAIMDDYQAFARELGEAADALFARHFSGNAEAQPAGAACDASYGVRADNGTPAPTREE